MKKLLIILFVCFWVTMTPVFGSDTAQATDVGGTIDTDTTWTLDESPYTLTSNVQIAEGVILTIEPGVTVNGDWESIGVSGVLNAVGDETSYIVFNNTRINNGNSEGVSINVQFSEINGGSIFGLNHRVYGSGSLVLKDSILQNMSYTIYLSFPEEECSIERNIFLNSGRISVSSSSKKVYVRNNVFYHQIGEYAVLNYANDFSPETIVEHNSFLSTDRIALRLMSESGRMTATNNYWNTTETDVIDSMIWDGNDDLGCGENYIEYEPFLEEPHSDTPALSKLMELLAPSDLSAAPISDSQIDLSWTNNSPDESGFSIERKTESEGTYSQIAEVDTGVIFFSDTSLSESTTYYYRVMAYGGVNSGYSNEAHATTLETPTLPSSVESGSGSGCFISTTLE